MLSNDDFFLRIMISFLVRGSPDQEQEGQNADPPDEHQQDDDDFPCVRQIRCNSHGKAGCPECRSHLKGNLQKGELRISEGEQDDCQAANQDSGCEHNVRFDYILLHDFLFKHFDMRIALGICVDAQHHDGEGGCPDSSADTAGRGADKHQDRDKEQGWL